MTGGHLIKKEKGKKNRKNVRAAQVTVNKMSDAFRDIKTCLFRWVTKPISVILGQTVWA